MKSSRNEFRKMRNKLADLRQAQYAALNGTPTDWDTVGRIGKQILALEIQRKACAGGRAAAASKRVR